MAHRIILATLNAKYIHASLGLRYLLANMQRHGGADLQAHTVLQEFTINRPAQGIVDELWAELSACAQDAHAVLVVGFGVYIWNVVQTCEVVCLLKAQHPRVKVVLGGPEVSHELDTQPIVALADYVITGWGDVSFPRLCKALVHGPRPLMKVIAGEQPALDDIDFPYAHYSAQDLAHRVLYVEASRGCPFKCEFCLSSLDKTAWAFDLDRFLAELDALYARGARTFKFVDRTFNLKIDASVRVLQFFLDRLPPAGQKPDLFLHFEVIPDHLPDRLKAMIALFPAGVLQFEVGIQSFNPDVQQRISRRQDNDKTEANVHWLVTQSHAHLHTDLIFGLPGESWQSFGEGFDRLWALRPHEIQLGVLKRLRGTPLANRSMVPGQDPDGLDYEPLPPYTVRSSAAVSAQEVQTFVRLARYWDMVANSGRFTATMDLLMQGPSAFAAFADVADYLWVQLNATSGITPDQLVDSLFEYLCGPKGCDPALARAALLADYLASGAHANPKALHGLLPKRMARGGAALASGGAQRQQRHQASQPVPATAADAA
ncbi:B12-binding domain-containing radical SAM protein [Rhodoferax aquaticus]|uniref:DUF4080 domain-containing protein n=1 Tax=Rhodoferax aquaticus TaxID=2527691 RepID=A0A515EU44_9BURK|nr:radical SAM protein [Rhodoferax aquaticus]QDL56138.1 DUF4080 domain-containing protein [Rhodoferax aquaticus]